MKRITDPTSRYHPSYDTDVKRTFRRERARQARARREAIAMARTTKRLLREAA